jgi:hypothetical protein
LPFHNGRQLREWSQCQANGIVTAGLGWAQADGNPIEEIRPGDVVIVMVRAKM